MKQQLVQLATEGSDTSIFSRSFIYTIHSMLVLPGKQHIIAWEQQAQQEKVQLIASFARPEFTCQ